MKSQKARLKALRKKYHLGEYRKSVSTHKTKHTTEVKTMARKRYFGKRRSKRSRGSSSSVSPVNLAIGSAIYGGTRNYIAGMVPDIAALQGYSDNVILGVGGYLLATKGKGKLMKTAGMSILASEAFIAGSKAMSGITGSNTTSSNQAGGF